MENLLLKEKCDHLVRSRNAIREVFSWDAGLMTAAAAGMFVSAGREADKDELERCKKIIKTSNVAELRGNIRVPLACRMALSADPEKYFERVRKLFALISGGKLFTSEHRAMAALSIADHDIPEDEFENVVANTKKIFERMREEDKWHTGNEDYPYAALLAMSGAEPDDIFAEIGKIRDLLLEKFKSKNAVQTLANVLVLDERDAEAKCEKVGKLFDELKSMNHKYGAGHELATLGAFVLVDKDEKEIAHLICEADDYLAKQKGFGGLTMSSTHRRLYAAQLVLSLYGNESAASEGAMLGSMLAITIAMEVCLLICLSTSSAVATTAN